MFFRPFLNDGVLADATGVPDFPSQWRGSGKEEIFSTEIAYSEQAAILLKGSFPRESRRIKDESSLPVRLLLTPFEYLLTFLNICLTASEIRILSVLTLKCHGELFFPSFGLEI